MNVDLYSATGQKKGSLELPANLFEGTINRGLMHLALVRQQSNRRMPIAHVKQRGEVVGTTKKAYAQKHTGNARRGALRSPLVRGGGKVFGPRNKANFRKDMPQKMRRAALVSCLTYRAKQGAIIGLENYPDEVKTKTLSTLLGKLPVELGRRIVIVTSGRHRGLELSARNLPRVKTLFAQYLNPEDVLGAKTIIFLADAVQTASETFSAIDAPVKKTKPEEKAAPAPEKAPKAKAPKKKAASEKASSKTTA